MHWQRFEPPVSRSILVANSFLVMSEHTSTVATLVAINVRPDEALQEGELNLVSSVPAEYSAMSMEWNCVIGNPDWLHNSEVLVPLVDVIMQKVLVKATLVAKACEVSDTYTWDDGAQSAIIVHSFSDFAGVWGEINIELNYKMVRRTFPEIASRGRFLETLVTLLKSIHGGLGDKYEPCMEQMVSAGLWDYRLGYDDAVDMTLERIGPKILKVIFIGYTKEFKARFQAESNDYQARFSLDSGFSMKCLRTGRANPGKCFRVIDFIRMGADVTPCVQQLMFIINRVLFGLSIYLHIENNFPLSRRFEHVLTELGEVRRIESDSWTERGPLPLY